MRIAVVTARYSVSGVPLAQIRLADAWRRRGAEVDEIFGFVAPEHSAVLEAPSRLTFGAQRALLMLPSLVRYLWSERPDIVFSAEDHLNSIVLLAAFLAGSRAKICCSSRVTPLDTYGRGGLLRRVVLKALMQAMMGRARLLTCVSQDMVQQYREMFGDRGHVCVYNIVDRDRARHLVVAPVAHPWFENSSAKIVVAAGSLEPWKGFAELIRAMTVVHADAKLLILGEGNQRAELEQLIRSLGLSGRVHLVGRVGNPLAYFSKCQVFVLSSRIEGMPNVLVEAMMCGCTPVSTNCPTGPRELLEGSEHGRLVAVGDWEAMGFAINSAIESPAPRDWLEEVIAPFAEKAVIRRYERLLDMEDWRNS